MNCFKRILAIFAFGLLIAGLPAVASAQWRDYNERGRGATYNNNIRMLHMLNRLEEKARIFADQVDGELDYTRYNETRREDRISDIVEDFEDAVDKLEDNFDEGNGGRDDSYADAGRVLTLGKRVENVLGRARINSALRSQWASIRQDLNTIANYYGYNNLPYGNTRRNSGRRVSTRSY